MELLLVGCGKWGRNYVKTLSNHPNIKLKIADRFNWQKLIDQKPNGVIVCTPPDSHIEIAKYSLDQNIPTMIEKPLALSLQDCLRIENYDKRVPILVNHIHLFSESYQRLKTEINPEKITNIISVGVGNGPERPYSILWDWAPHDLSMILDLVGQDPYYFRVYKTVKDKSHCTYRINLDFYIFNANVIIGNAARIKKRNLIVNHDFRKSIYNGFKQKEIISPLEKALKVFINAINGKGDSRLGLDLSFRVIQLLDKIQRAEENARIINANRSTS